MKQDFGYYLSTPATDLPIPLLSVRLRYLPATAQAGDVHRAVVAPDQAGALSFDPSTAYHAFAWVYLCLDQPQQAIVDLEQPFHLQRSPQHPEQTASFAEEAL